MTLQLRFKCLILTLTLHVALMACTENSAEGDERAESGNGEDASERDNRNLIDTDTPQTL